MKAPPFLLKNSSAFIIQFILVSVFSLVMSFTSKGQALSKKFENISFEEGLPDKTCFSMIQDQLGFMWIGTNVGLVRYDGYDFDSYLPDSDDPHSIKGRSILSLIESKDGNLWIGTQWGLHYFNRDTRHFTNILIDSNRVNPNPEYAWVLHYLYEDKKGHIWTISGEERKLHRYDPSSKIVHAVYLKPGDKEPLNVAKAHNYWNQAPIEADKNGNLWIGTYQGLVKYELEEEKLTLFSKTTLKTNDLKNDTIYALLIEKDSILWMGTETGLAKFDMDNERFLPFYIETDSMAFKTANSPVYDLRMGQNNCGIWILRSFSLEKMDNDQEILKTMISLPEPLDLDLDWNLNNPSFQFIGKDVKGNIYFSHNMNRIHIYNYDCTKDLLTTYQIEFEGMDNSWSHGGIYQTISNGLVDRNGLLWFGHTAQGILKENRKKGPFENYDLNSEGLSSFFEDTEGRIWIPGPKHALFHPEIKKIIDLASPPEYEKRINYYEIGWGTINFKWTITEFDRTIWFGTGDGVYKIPLANHQKAYKNIAFGKDVFASSIKSRRLLCLPEFATDGNKFSRWASEVEDLSWIVIDLEETIPIKKIVLHWESAARRYVIQVSDNMKDWRTVYSESLGMGGIEEIALNAKGRYVRLLEMEINSALRYNYEESNYYSLWEIEIYSASPQIVHYKHDPNDPNTIRSNDVSNLLVDKNENLWIATQNGFSKYDSQNDHFIHYPQVPEDYYVYLKEDCRGTIWGCGADELFSFDPEAGTIKPYYTIPGDTTSISHHFVRSIFEDNEENLWFCGSGINRYNYEQDNFTRFLSDKGISNILQCSNGFFWMGTKFSGLFRFDPITYELKNYNEKDGLANNMVGDIHEDNQGRLWIGTRRGLSCFYPDKEKFVNYSKNDGLHSNNALGPSHKDSRGFLYFSWRGKFTVFNPEIISADPTVPQIVINDLKIAHQSVFPNEEKSPLTKDISVTNQVRLKHFQNVLTLGFVALHYNNPERNLYKVKMEGQDTSWVELGNQRQINYSGLPPGTYTFMVKGANSDGIWNETPASLKITILPPWWWNAWSKTLYLLISLGFIYALYHFQLRRQLATAEAQRLQELDIFKTRLYTNLTHEFRTPITVISGMADQILENPKTWFREGLGMIKRNSRNLLGMVNQMLDLSKLESGNLTINLIQGDLVAYLRYLTDSLHSYFESKDIHLHLLPEVNELYMDFDPEKIQTIFSNLMSNAFKFTPPGGDVFIKIQEHKTDQSYCRIRLADTGAGIAEDQLPYIFDRFFQADDSVTRQAEGTGIGLSLTKELVKLLGGTIEATSQLGKGTEFTVLLPIHRTAEKGTPETALAGQLFQAPSTSVTKNLIHTPAKNGTPLALLIEDNPDVLKYLCACLQEQYRLETAVNGQQGIEKAIDLVPDIIISDIMMPEKDGFEVCVTLKQDERTSHIPIILLTAKATEEDRIAGLEVGADAYLMKPFNKQELFVRLEKLIEIRQRLRERYQSLKLPVATQNKALQKEDAFLHKINKTIEDHLVDENFNAIQLCKAMNYSRTQLYHKLKVLTGMSVAVYIRSIRLKKAEELLQTTDLNISEIAYEVGFKDPNYFTRSYREEFGITPSQTRK